MNPFNTFRMTHQERLARPAGAFVPVRGASLLRGMLFLLAALPALYVFFAIQYASITVPFWDHTELIHWLASWYDGNFRFSSLWAPHNQTRPLVYRLVMVFNAVLTDWDVRSEYIYMYLALYGIFACHVWALHRVTAGALRKTVYPLALLLASLILFSPVGHNNHWWSMMFQLDAANLFIAFGMLTLFLRPQRWSSHISAAVACWLASYTLTNGIFAMLAIGLVFQLSATRLLHPTRWTLFWGGNLFVLLVCYLPGITLSTSPTHPTLLQLAEFFLAYLGAPLGGLLWFPYRNMFDIPLPIATNAVCGGLLVASSAMLCWHARTRLREQHGAALILFGFTIFAMVSALATGWGRAAFDEYGVSNANASRYTIFGAYLMLGQLYYLAAGFAHGWWNNARLRCIAVICAMAFVLLSMVTYDRAVKVYVDAHNFNKTLINAYTWGLQPTAQDKFIDPYPGSVKRLKRDLQRLELGPYNSRQFNRQSLPVGEFNKVGLLSGSRQIAQYFTATEDGLKAVAVTLVTPNGKRTAGSIEWQVTEVGTAQPVARGTLNAARIQDWEEVRLKLPYLSDSKGREYLLALSAKSDDAHGAGVALYAPAINSKPTLVVTEQAGSTKMESLSMALRMDYTK
ncbi:hypothetical protein [Sulfuriferula sp.]|uniref:hypothetical protein n=1 Tax=Sulfuriferula sp. TaxID=2025307 RepID=UPI00272FD23A|nr:hypothetical protein [Sulfuriferula sp.]MDP2025017.1 hypothetical protein [Sulfuriferula sp.]